MSVRMCRLVCMHTSFVNRDVLPRPRGRGLGLSNVSSLCEDKEFVCVKRERQGEVKKKERGRGDKGRGKGEDPFYLNS
jgi:hypothetical protein